MFSGSLWLWVGFTVLVLALLAVDLGVFHRKAREVFLKEALLWSTAWIGLALLFNVGIYLFKGTDPALQFFTGYLIEKSLSVDNIFVFVLLFAAFGVPPIHQHRVLLWGVLGALVMRGLLIALGSILLGTFHWIMYLFGAFLIFTGLRMALMAHREPEQHPERNILLRFLRRVVPVTDGYRGERFFVREAGQLMVTPLILVLLIVESTDLLFAVDSLPAVFAVTPDPFIVYTSNVFALLGLRSLYFVFARIINKFVYLKPALAIILSFVGIKMVLADVYHIPSVLSLLFIALVLVVAIGASIVYARRSVPVEKQRRSDAA